MSTIVVVKIVHGRTCTACERPLRATRLYVRSKLSRSRGPLLSFAVGAFCSVKCLLRFAARQESEGRGTVRGWTFGECADG